MCKIIYEDNHLLIVEKPPNLLTQGDATGDDCLTEAMKRYLKEKYQKPGEVYLGLIHRLDRPVGGLVALAKTGKAASRLSEQLRARTLHREYLAVAQGAPDDEGELSDWLKKDERTGNVMVAAPGAPSAQEARLHFRTLARRGGTALMHLCLDTGRKHQIRVQLSHAGWPIVQDLRYGQGKAGEAIALWGAVLTLRHPTLQTTMVFESAPQGRAFAPYQADIEQFLAERARS